MVGEPIELEPSTTATTDDTTIADRTTSDTPLSYQSSSSSSPSDVQTFVELRLGRRDGDTALLLLLGVELGMVRSDWLLLLLLLQRMGLQVLMSGVVGMSVLLLLLARGKWERLVTTLMSVVVMVVMMLIMLMGAQVLSVLDLG